MEWRHSKSHFKPEDHGQQGGSDSSLGYQEDLEQRSPKQNLEDGTGVRQVSGGGEGTTTEQEA